MSFRVLLVCALTTLVCSSASAQLTCAASGSNQCDALHYHVGSWNPETRQHVEVYGQNSFSTLELCEAAKTAEAALDAAAISYLRKAAPKMKTSSSKFGVCHCDLTEVKTHSNYLVQSRRDAMIRGHRELKLLMVELLVQEDATMDHEVVRAYLSGASALGTSISYWPREATFIEARGSQILDESQTKMEPTAITSPKSAGIVGGSIGLAAVNLDFKVFAAAPDESTEASVAEIPFLGVEMSRISGILESIAESDDAESLLEAANVRIQILTNLRKVAESGGERSRLLSRMRAAATENERRLLISSMFGSLVAAHWAPADAKKMQFSIPASIRNDPVAILRDTTGRYTDDQRKLALFFFLSANAELTESEEIWVSNIIDGNLPEGASK